MTDRYRKKPVEVRAWKIGFDGQEPDWVRKAFDGRGRIDWCPAGEGIYINTLEGRMKANIGDMLIEGVKGELYGCRADIFAVTYEPVETPSPPPSFPAQPATELRRLHAAESERDEALLRQALKALEAVVEHFDPYMGDNECRPMENARSTIAALRERLGEGAGPLGPRRMT